jgi:methionine-rich copper-binding protein CopC
MTRHLVPAVAALMLAGPAVAHSTKEDVIPARDATLASAPAEIAMSFDAAMRITRIALTDGDGRSFDLERADGMAPVTEFTAMPETLPPGDYTVEWSGIAEDGHTMSGSWSFRVR